MADLLDFLGGNMALMEHACREDPHPGPQQLPGILRIPDASGCD